jgi:hypothetical protein
MYWGNAWTGALSGLATQINQFFSFILTSSLIDQLTEYSVPNFAISHGSFVGTVSCAYRKSNPNILVVQPAQDRAAKNGPGQFDGARDRRILLQR